MTDYRFIPCAETAKLVRVALKRSFPTIKFSVKSHVYSGGASINVSWTDGPTADQVEAIVKPYAGGGFDGMIDLAYSNLSWLMPDGSATFAKTRGTTGSGGTEPADQQMQPSFKSELVRFGSDYVFCKRQYSEGFYRRAFEAACRRYGQQPDSFTITVSSFGTPYIDRGDDRFIQGHDYMSDLVRRELSRRAVALPVTA